MSHVCIRCPHCDYSRQTERSKIPPTAQQVNCPRCGQAFSLSEAIRLVEPSAAQQAGDASALTDAEVAATIHSPLPSDASDAVEPAANRPGSGGQHPVARQIRFAFTGTGSEYFGIWIVNTLLKIVTLGFYSPWAKVRKRSYFYGSTQLEGMNFDYLANPIALLKGWLLGAALFLLYTLGANYSPLLSMVVGALIFGLMPWLIVRSRLFNNRNSAHRNIRFNFYPDYRGAYLAYLWLPLLTPFTLGLLFPYMLYRQKQFLVENNSYGKTPFKFLATAKDYYLLFLRGLGLVVLLGLAGFAMFAWLAPLAQGSAQSAPLLVVLLPVLFLAGYLLVALYYYVRLANLTWNSTRLGKHRFCSDLKIMELAWIFFSSGMAIILSFGLLTPWAAIRLARYRLQRLAVVAHGDLATFESANRSEVSAVGEEISDIFGMDIGL